MATTGAKADAGASTAAARSAAAAAAAAASSSAAATAAQGADGGGASGGGGVAPDRVELRECIGRGSYGDVYRGVDAATGQQVAVKVIDLEDM